MKRHTNLKTANLPKSESTSSHRKQSFWQIILPVVISAVVILVILALVIQTAVGTDAGGLVSQWADTSLIWLSLPVLLFALGMLLIMIVLIAFLAQLLKVVPGLAQLIQHYVNLIFGIIHTGADKLVAPIISLRSFQARVSAFKNALLGKSKG